MSSSSSISSMGSSGSGSEGALHAALVKRDIRTAVQLLKAAGGPGSKEAKELANAVDEKSGETPLITVIQLSKNLEGRELQPIKEMMEILVDYGADPKAGALELAKQTNRAVYSHLQDHMRVNDCRVS